MWLGLVLASAMLGLVLPLDILHITLLRAISGIGQGMLFIGIQAYILAVAPAEKKTQGAAIIVFGFQGGMISGMAIGSLLVNYLHPQGVFMLSGAIGFATAIYSMLLIPRAVELGARHSTIYGIGSGLKSVFCSGEFLKTMFCIGVPAKAILTGTITFGLPLLLGQNGYRQERSARSSCSTPSAWWSRAGTSPAWLTAPEARPPFCSGSRAERLRAGADRAHGVVLRGQRHAQHRRGHRRRHFRRHRSWLHQRAGRDARGAFRARATNRRQLGDDGLSFPRADRSCRGAGLGRAAVPDLGSKPADPGGDRIATAILGFLFVVYSTPPRVEHIGQEMVR